ncbi:hypothetical protein BH23ACT11_BH23ACT11_23950 [soil metagenome]
MNFLKSKAFSQFEDSFLDLKVGSGNRLSTKTATEIATSLTTGLFQPIYEQIEPNRLGEIARAMSIAQEYGQRLDNTSDNLKSRALQRLVNGYPSHRFVIDCEEAADLFKRVREPTEAEQAMVESLEDVVDGLSRVPNAHALPTDTNPEPFVGFVSTGLEKGEVHGERQGGGTDTEGEREENGRTPTRAEPNFGSPVSPEGNTERR